MPSKHIPAWTPGCGRPHPDADLIRAWAEGKVMLVEKQRVTTEGKTYGQPLRVQYPCWNSDEWKFEVARNSQMILDLTDSLVSTRPTKVRKLPISMGQHQDYSAQR